MINNTLLIHIGMPKTGTSALQKFLFANASKLEKYGWAYPVLLDQKDINSERLMMIEQSGNGRDLYVEGVLNNHKSEWNTGIEIISTHLKVRNVILSSEDISEYETDKFLEGVKEKCENVKVVIYLRRQDREIESIYNEHIKSAGEYNTFQEFITSDDSYKTWVDYLSKLDTISRIVGKENLIVRIYEKQQLIGNDTVTDFLSVLGIPADKEEWIRSKGANLSVGGNYLEINRLINSAQSADHHFDSWDIKYDVRDICVELSSFFNQKKGEHGFFVPDERKKFLKKFARDNERIAREYLQREDGTLFYDERMDFAVYETNQYSEFEADIVRVFASLIFAQDRRTKNLIERKCGELSGKLLMKDILQKSEERQLLLFGKGYKCHKLFEAVENIPAALIADNDISKQGTTLNGVQVRYAKGITNWRKYFVVVTCEKTDEIEVQLHDYGLKKERDYILAKEYGF